MLTSLSAETLSLDDYLVNLETCAASPCQLTATPLTPIVRRSGGNKVCVMLTQDALQLWQGWCFLATDMLGIGDNFEESLCDLTSLTMAIVLYQGLWTANDVLLCHGTKDILVTRLGLKLEDLLRFASRCPGCRLLWHCVQPSPCFLLLYGHHLVGRFLLDPCPAFLQE